MVDIYRCWHIGILAYINEDLWIIRTLLLHMQYYGIRPAAYRLATGITTWKVPMLKDFLNALVVEAENTAECRIGRLIKELDSETAEAFKSAMRSKASSRSIWEALRRSDISVDRAAIDKGRKCFREQQDCSCGMGSNNG